VPEFNPGAIFETLVRHDWISSSSVVSRASPTGPHTTPRTLMLTIRVSSLDHLIAMKEAAARPRDLTMAAEYRTIAELRRAPKDDEAG
jgi:hypothetical protein